MCGDGPRPRAHAAKVELRPRLTLWLLSAQHGLIHAQTAVLPLVFIVVIDRFGIGVNDVGLLLAAGNILAGAVQLVYAPLSRVVTRRTILGVGGLVYGVGMTALATATSWLPFSFFTIVARVGGSPQHPVGNALIAEQRPVREHAGRSPRTSPAGTSAPSPYPSWARGSSPRTAGPSPWR